MNAAGSEEVSNSCFSHDSLIYETKADVAYP